MRPDPGGAPQEPETEGKKVFTIYSDSSSDSTMVSNLFIDEYMKSANDAQIKIYLYLLRMMGTHRPTSVSDLADQFNHTEKDVVRSLRYWERRGLLNLTFDKKDDLVSICLCRPGPADSHVLSFTPPEERQRAVPELLSARAENGGLRPAAGGAQALSPAGSQESGSACAQSSGTKNSASALLFSLPERSDSRTGTPAQNPVSELEALESFRASKERARLLFIIEQYIGKPLSLNEIRTIYHISERLGFSDDLLDYLIQYCVDRGKKDFRYIGKVAENWAAQGVMTPAQAETASAAQTRSRGRKASGKDAGAAAGPDADKPSGSSGKKQGKTSRTPRTSNSFNQFEQNSYDFDALEEELLQS